MGLGVQQFPAEEPAPLAGGAGFAAAAAVVISLPCDLRGAQYRKKRETIWTATKPTHRDPRHDQPDHRDRWAILTTATTTPIMRDGGGPGWRWHAAHGTCAIAAGMVTLAMSPRPPGHQPGGPPVHPARPDPRGLHLARGRAGFRCRPLYAIEKLRACDPPRQGRSWIWKPTKYATAPATTSSTSASITRTVDIVRSASGACPPTASAPSPSARSRWLKSPRCAAASAHLSSASSTGARAGIEGTFS